MYIHGIIGPANLRETEGVTVGDTRRAQEPCPFESFLVWSRQDGAQTTQIRGTTSVSSGG